MLNVKAKRSDRAMFLDRKRYWEKKWVVFEEELKIMKFMAQLEGNGDMIWFCDNTQAFYYSYDFRTKARSYIDIIFSFYVRLHPKTHRSRFDQILSGFMSYKPSTWTMTPASGGKQYYDHVRNRFRKDRDKI